MSIDDDCKIKAFMFLTIQLGKTTEVLTRLKRISSIKSIAVTTGNYDIIIKIEVESMEKMFDFTQDIHLIPGIIETNTSIIQKEV
jgi:DNA-binding Lrp family transcriptional regulator